MQKNNHVPFLILGAGMAGLGAGVEFQRQNRQSLILEKAVSPGGLCRSQTTGKCNFDYGPKILFLDNSKNSKQILSVLNGNFKKYPVAESVYLSKYGLVGFPLQRYLVDLPYSVRKKILDDLLKAQINPREVKSFKDWLINTFGKYFCELIMFPYEEKKWQIDLDKMDYHWALRRPIKVDVQEIIKGASKRLQPNRFYYYPRRGNIAILSQALAKKAGSIKTRSEVIAIDLQKKCVETNGVRYFYDVLVSTLPLDQVVDITTPISQELRQKASRYLKRLGIVIFNLVFLGNHKLKGTAIYFPEKQFIFRRVSVLENLCPSLYRSGYTPISVEISVKQGSRVDEKDLLGKVLEGFKRIDQFARLGKPVSYSTLKIGFAYPLQVNGLSNFVAKIHDFYKSNDVYHCGRGGSFDYCNSDRAFLQGKETARDLCE